MTILDYLFKERHPPPPDHVVFGKLQFSFKVISHAMFTQQVFMVILNFFKSDTFFLIQYLFIFPIFDVVC